VISGWGRKADWFLNVAELPALEIQIGRERFAPVQHILSDDEAFAVLDEWQRSHPTEARIFKKAYGLPRELSQPVLRDFVESHPMIAFRPRSASHSAETQQ
jgi:hypothetical protein